MAVTIGIPTRPAVPKATSRMITAAARPTASVLSVDGPRQLLAEVAADLGAPCRRLAPGRPASRICCGLVLAGARSRRVAA